MKLRAAAWALLIGNLWTAGPAEELPSLAQFRQRLAEGPPPEAPRGAVSAGTPVEGRGVPGAPAPIGVRERLWTLDLVFDLTVRGEPAGEIASGPEGYVFTDSQGARVAVCERLGGSKGARPAAAAVTDAAGARIGEIVRTSMGSHGQREFQVRDAAGTVVGDTREVAFIEPDFALWSPRGSLVARYKSEGWLGGAWSVVPASDADARLALMVLVQNAAEDMRESKRRHDPRRRRRGRHGP